MEITWVILIALGGLFLKIERRLSRIETKIEVCPHIDKSIGGRRQDPAGEAIDIASR